MLCDTDDRAVELCRTTWNQEICRSRNSALEVGERRFASAMNSNAVFIDLPNRLRIIAILMSPIFPKAAHGIFDQLNWKMELSGKEERFSLGDAEWGKLPDGHVVGKPTPLFPRIET